MARQVRYIEPIESISGDLGQKQSLYYGNHNNSAWDAPRDRVNGARNYRTTYIGLKRKRSGRNYFAVRKQSSFNASPAMIFNCALMGAANTIAATLMKDLNFSAMIQAAYRAYLAEGGKKGMRAYVVEKIQPLIESGALQITIVQSGAVYPFGNNPYTTAQSAIAIPSDKLVKFWEPIAYNPGYFYVNGARGIWAGNGSASFYIGNARLNVLGLSSQTIGSSSYVRMGEQYLIRANGSYVLTNSPIAAGERFTLTAVAPNS